MAQPTQQLTAALEAALAELSPALSCRAVKTEVNPATREWVAHMIEVRHRQGGKATARIEVYRGDAGVSWLDEHPPRNVAEAVKRVSTEFAKSQWEENP